MHNLITSLMDNMEQRKLQSILDHTGEKPRLVGIGRLERWEPQKLDEKFNLEFKMLAYGATPQQAAQMALKELAKRGIRPDSIKLSKNTVVNGGLTDYNNGLTTTGLATPYSNANAKIAVGDTTGATVLTDTDIHAAAAAGNRRIDAMDATYPTIATGVATFRVTFATGNANFHWQEWAITNSGAVGSGALTRILNRAASDLGTKTSAQAWQFTVTVTLA